MITHDVVLSTRSQFRPNTLLFTGTYSLFGYKYKIDTRLKSYLNATGIFNVLTKISKFPNQKTFALTIILKIFQSGGKFGSGALPGKMLLERIIENDI